MIPRLPRCDTMGRVVTAGLTVVSPASLLAQARVPEPGSVQADTGASTTPASQWRLQLTASGSWYENARFSFGDEPATWSTSGRGSLAHTSTFRRGSFAIAGYGGVLYYPEIDSYNQATYGGSLGLTWDPSRRTQLRATQNYHRSNTRELPSLDEEGLPLPTSGIDTATTTLGLVQGLSRRWQLGLDGAFTWRRYDNEALVGGERAFGQVQLARELGKHSAAYLSYGYGVSWFDDRHYRVHQALLGARTELAKNVDFDIAGGVAYLESVGQLYPAGHAGIRASGRRTSFALRYTRDFGQAFGYGRETIADLVSVTFGWTPVRRLSFSAGYYFGYRRDPAETGYTIRSHVASAGFGWTIVRDLGFSARYYWEQNETEGFTAVDGSRVTASLSYGVSWR